MAENTSIEWCDHTFNPWSGCTKVSPGCAHCYAESLSKRNPATLGVWGKGQPRKRMSEAYWRQPLKWNQDAPAFSQCEACGWRGGREIKKRASGNGQLIAHCPGCDARGSLRAGQRPRVFCASLADWLDDEVPIEWLADLLNLIRRTPNLGWQLLSKRPQNWRTRMEASLDYMVQRSPVESCTWLADWLGIKFRGATNPCPPPNVWIGTTVEDQTRADERIPLLLSIPAKVRFLSCEPLLGPVELAKVQVSDVAAVLGGEWDRLGMDRTQFRGKSGRLNLMTNQVWPEGSDDKGWLGGIASIDWVICGGESGPGARPMHPDWARSLRDQCAAAGVPFLFKQWGEWWWDIQNPFGTGYPEREKHWFTDPVTCMIRVGKKAAGRLLDGVEHNEFPQPAAPGGKRLIYCHAAQIFV